MLKQVYRFLSIFLISNFLLSHAVLGKPQKNVINSNKTVCHNNQSDKTKQESISNKDSVNKKPDIEKMPPYKGDSGKFIALYGVMNLGDFHNTYTDPDIKSPNPNDDKH